MDFKLRYIPLMLFVAINTICVVAMNVCAYSSYLPPQNYPNWSYLGLAFPIFLVINVLFVVFWLIFKRVFALLPIGGMLLCVWAVRAYIPINMNDEVPEGALKIMSYNVLNFGYDKTTKWENKPVVRYILDSGADIVCIQELGWIDPKMKKGRIPIENYPYHSLLASNAGGMGCLSKYPILQTRKVEYESKGNRSYAYDIVVGEDTILVINNHLESYKLNDEDKAKYKELIKNPKETDSEGKYDALTDKLAAANKLRGPQANAVARFVRENKDKYRHIIVCGDFNDTPISYTHNVLTKELNDAYTRAGNGPGLSYHRSGMFFRLDHILVSEAVKPYKTVVDRSFDGSDHYPIYSYVELK